MTPQDPRRESVRETRRHFPGDPGRPVVADAGAARAHPRIPQTAFRPASGQRLTPPLRGAAGRRVPGLAKGREPGALGRRGGEFPRAVPRLGRKGSPRTLSRVGCLAGGPGDAGGRRARPRFRPRHPLRRGCWGQNHSPARCRGGCPREIPLHSERARSMCPNPLRHAGFEPRVGRGGGGHVRESNLPGHGLPAWRGETRIHLRKRVVPHPGQVGGDARATRLAEERGRAVDGGLAAAFARRHPAHRRGSGSRSGVRSRRRGHPPGRCEIRSRSPVPTRRPAGRALRRRGSSPGRTRWSPQH